MKPRIRKRDGWWRVSRPGYGFNPDTVEVFSSWREAVGSLRSAPAAASSQVAKADFTLGLSYRGIPLHRGTIRMEDT